MGDLDDLDLEAELASMAMEVEGAEQELKEDPPRAGIEGDKKPTEASNSETKEEGPESEERAENDFDGDPRSDGSPSELGEEKALGKGGTSGDVAEKDDGEAKGEETSDPSPSRASAAEVADAPSAPAAADSVRQEATRQAAATSSAAKRPMSPPNVPSSPARPSFARHASRRPTPNVQAKPAPSSPASNGDKAPAATATQRLLPKPGVPAARVVADALRLDPAEEGENESLNSLACASERIDQEKDGKRKSDTQVPEPVRQTHNVAPPSASSPKPAAPKPPTVPKAGRRAFSLAQAPSVALQTAPAAITAPKTSVAAGASMAATATEKPKIVKGRNAFYYFSNARRADVKALHPTLASGGITSKLAAMYRALTPEEREVYEVMARENAAAATLASATPPVAKKSPASTSKATALLAVSVKTPFQLFCDDLRPSLTADNPRAGAVEIAKLLAAAWRDAPEEDKAIYTAQHQELRAEAKKAGNAPVTTTVPQPAKSAGKGKGKDARGKKRKGAPPEEEVAVEKEPEEPDSDDEDRRTCDWISHPPSFIISEDSSRDMYLVAREGLPLQEYGVVTASEAKAARLDGRESVLAAELIDGFEAFRKRFLADVHRAQDMGELDLERLDPSSTLEACAILGTLRENGRELASKDKRDIWMKVPLLATCRVVQWLMSNARRQGERNALRPREGKPRETDRASPTTVEALDHEP